MPAEVRIIATSVGENSKLEVAFADENLAATRLGSGADNPRSILVKRKGAVHTWWKEVEVEAAS
jgi:hypothetical protein